MLSILAHGFVLAPIAVVFVYNMFRPDFARRHFVWFAGAGAALQLVSAGAAFAALRAGALDSYRFSIFWNMDAPGAAYFELNALKLFLLFVIGLVGFVSVLVAKQTIDYNRSSYTNLLMILFLGMNGMLVVTDLFSLFVFMEVTGICCFVMIAMFRSRANLEGSFKYLVMSELASIFMLIGLAFLFMRGGSLRYEDLRELSVAGGMFEDKLARLAMALLLSGFALKAGAVPFHSWLPDAHQSADTSVSVLLSGVVIKIAGVYALMTVCRLFEEFASMRTVLAVLGAVSIIAGALLASRQKHFKRVVAYSSVSQVGYILLALSAGTTLGMLAALAHTLSHAVFKTALFANAAALHEQAGTLELDALGGLEKQMPATAFSSLVAFFSLAGIPPSLGFWSKLLILLALWGSGHKIYAGLALLASIFTSVYMLRLQKKVFFGRLRETMKNVREVRGTVLAAELLLTALTILIGCGFPFILSVLRAHGLL